MAKQLAPFAAKHNVWVAFHNHTGNYPAMDKTDPLLELSPSIGFNLHIGHHVAGNKGLSPIPVLEKFHDRIVSFHLKDRTADSGDVPWGQGQRPIKEVLHTNRPKHSEFNDRLHRYEPDRRQQSRGADGFIGYSSVKSVVNTPVSKVRLSGAFGIS